MSSDRLKALTDGVIAIVITIMVLEMRPPTGDSLAALGALSPVFLSYALSFLFIAIYWNNHHHFLVLAPTVDGAVLWANLSLLFWISLIPFTTSWMGEHLEVPGLAPLMGQRSSPARSPGTSCKQPSFVHKGGRHPCSAPWART